MLLVSEDLSSMTVWTILSYTRYVGKLSTRSLSYLCPDLPSCDTRFAVFQTNCIQFRNRSRHPLRYLVYMWKWLLLWFFMTLNSVYRYKCVFLLICIAIFNKDSHLNEVFIVICITAWVNVKASCAIKNINTHLQEAQTGANRGYLAHE